MNLLHLLAYWNFQSRPNQISLKLVTNCLSQILTNCRFKILPLNYFIFLSSFSPSFSFCHQKKNSTILLSFNQNIPWLLAPLLVKWYLCMELKHHQLYCALKPHSIRRFLLQLTKVDGSLWRQYSRAVSSPLAWEKKPLFTIYDLLELGINFALMS